MLRCMNLGQTLGNFRVILLVGLLSDINTRLISLSPSRKGKELDSDCKGLRSSVQTQSLCRREQSWGVGVGGREGGGSGEMHTLVHTTPTYTQTGAHSIHAHASIFVIKQVAFGGSI